MKSIQPLAESLRIDSMQRLYVNQTLIVVRFKLNLSRKGGGASKISHILSTFPILVSDSQ